MPVSNSKGEDTLITFTTMRPSRQRLRNRGMPESILLLYQAHGNLNIIDFCFSPHRVENLECFQDKCGLVVGNNS